MIPERRLPSSPPAARHSPRAPIAPNAAIAKKLTPEDLPLSVTDWLLTLLVLAVPLVNIVLYLHWAFFSKGNRSRINFCRASLILAAFTLVLALLLR
jgi:hypothetical protein